LRKQTPTTRAQRVLTAFGRREPDRVPIGYYANAEIDEALKRHFGLGKDQSEELADRLGVDFRGVYVGYTGPPLHDVPEGYHVDERGARMRWVEHGAGGYWDFCDFPLAGTLSMDQARSWPFPDPDDYNYDDLLPRCEACADYALVLGGAGVACILNNLGSIRGMDGVLCDVVTEDPAGMLLLDRFNQLQLEVARRALAIAGDRVDLFCVGEDLGTQRGPIVNPETFRKVIKPRLQRFIDEAKKYDLPVMMHSCGSSSWAFDELADMGVDIMDTLQPEAADMDPAYLKQRFGPTLSFHGAISTTGALSFGTVQDVRDDVHRVLDIMMPGGGYALAPTHMIQSNSPLENVLAMYETALEYGVY
jgi:uroporphyrinogen decarboxylase